MGPLRPTSVKTFNKPPNHSILTQILVIRKSHGSSLNSRIFPKFSSFTIRNPFLWLPQVQCFQQRLFMGLGNVNPFLQRSFPCPLQAASQIIPNSFQYPIRLFPRSLALSGFLSVLSKFLVRRWTLPDSIQLLPSTLAVSILFLSSFYADFYNSFPILAYISNFSLVLSQYHIWVLPLQI